MADQLMPDTPRVYYRAVSTDGWPVTITLDSKLPIDRLGSPSQPGKTCKIIAMPVAGFQPDQSIVLFSAPSVFYEDVPPLVITELTQLLTKRIEAGGQHGFCARS